jgi:hypothetical protein
MAQFQAVVHFHHWIVVVLSLVICFAHWCVTIDPEAASRDAHQRFVSAVRQSF